MWGVVLAGCVAVTAAGCTKAVAGQPFAGPSAAPAPSQSPSAAAPSPTGSSVTVATMHVTLQQGMQYTSDGCVSDGSAVCVARMQDLRSASAEPGFTAPSAKRPYGWSTGTDAPQCVTPSGPGSPATGSTVVESGYAPIGSKKAEYARWQVTCTDATQNGQVRMWWLPTSKILVTEYGSSPDLDARIDAVLATATFG